METNRKAKAWVAGGGMAVIQIVWVLLLSPARTLAGRFSSFFEWDSGWYGSIFLRGYSSPVPPLPPGNNFNVAFFPGFPCFASLLRWVTNVDARSALVLAGLVGCIGFWMTYFALADSRAIPRKWAWIGAGAIQAHYASFYLAVAYSESLFLWMALLFVLALESQKVWGRPLAALAGFMLSFTRPVGIAFAVWAAIHTALGMRRVAGLRQWLREVAPAGLLISMATAAGAGVFFGYCQWKWGAWDLYLQAQRAGWGIHLDPSRFLAAATYFNARPGKWTWEVISDPISINRFSAAFAVFSWLSLLLADALYIRQEPNWTRFERAPMYGTMLFVLFISVTGSQSINFDGLSRYSLVPFVFLVIGTQQRFAHCSSERPGYAGWVWLPLIFFAAASLVAQVAVARIFLSGKVMY